MSIRIEWVIGFRPYDPTEKRFAVHLHPHLFPEAYAKLDTLSPQARENMSRLEMSLFSYPDHIRDRILKDRRDLTNMLCDDFRKSITEMLQRHDTIDGYPKS